MNIVVKWSYTGANEDSLSFRRVLYAYLRPGTREILYIGKADYCSVGERLRGKHKQAVFRFIAEELGLSRISALVGLLYVPFGVRFSSALLSDIESLLIAELQPVANVHNVRTRNCFRPGLAVVCQGAWPHRTKRFLDVGV